MNILLIILQVALILPIIGFIQNVRVYHYRDKIINYIYQKNVKEINEGKSDYRWRNDAYDNGGSYPEMVLKFWRPFDSFFSDRLIDEMKLCGKR